MTGGLFDRFHPLAKQEKQRLQALKRTDIPDIARPLFEHPVPQADTPLGTLDCVVLDFETTGLDPAKDSILSVGMLNLKYPFMSLSSAQHYYVKAGEKIVPDTAIINHITPETLKGGMPPQQLCEVLVKALAGKIVIAHWGWIEKEFMHRLLGIPADVRIPLVFLDTLTLEKTMVFNDGVIEPDFRLAGIRERRGLPPYLAHNAFADAVATGELFLAQVTDIFGRRTPLLGPVVRRSVAV